MSSLSVAITLPIFKPLESDEKISLRHLQTHLKQFPIFTIAPEEYYLGEIRSTKTVRLPAESFSSIQTYSRLLLSCEFYEKFLEFNYILIYQLDCLVFSDQIEAWCAAGYDYLGAPWFRDPNDPDRGFSRVGNGGLSLRRVQSHLQVLESRRIPPWIEAFSTRLPDLGGLSLLQRLYKQLKVICAARRGVDWYTSHYTLNEDHFWSDRARLFSPDFKIAPVNTGLKFSFERYPRYCFERNNHQLPFGCHAWAKWDREFWQPYLLQS